MWEFLRSLLRNNPGIRPRIYVAKRLSTTRSAFAREALRAALERYEEAELEARHREGYQRLPPSQDEFAIPEQDRAWGDDHGIDTW